MKEADKQQERISAKATLRKLSDDKGIAHVIGAVTKNINVDDEELNKIRTLFRAALEDDNLSGHAY